MKSAAYAAFDANLLNETASLRLATEILLLRVAARYCQGLRWGVASAIVSVVIKSDRLHKQVPKLGQMVKIEGRTGLFVVARVDRERLVVDLKQARNMLMVEESVPLKVLLPLQETVSQAIREFLTS